MNDPLEVPQLTVAAGTAFEFDVRDCRQLAHWSRYVGLPRAGQPRLIVYHHTASAGTIYGSLPDAIADLRRLRDGWPYGVPYNVLVVRAPELTALYLNDCDLSYPHTLGHNDAFAICAQGNFESRPAGEDLPRFMGDVADAFATMWGVWVPECLHRQLSATACPGGHLALALTDERELTPAA